MSIMFITLMLVAFFVSDWMAEIIVLDTFGFIFCKLVVWIAYPIIFVVWGAFGVKTKSFCK